MNLLLTERTINLFHEFATQNKSAERTQRRLEQIEIDM